MFGDAGHGIILTLFSAYMVIYEQQLSKTKSSNEVNMKVECKSVYDFYEVCLNMDLNSKY